MADLDFVTSRALSTGLSSPVNSATSRTSGPIDIEQLRKEPFYRSTLEAELLRTLARDDAKQLRDRAALEGSFAVIEAQHRMIYDELPEEVPELIPGLLPLHGNAAIVGETDTDKSLVAL